MKKLIIPFFIIACFFCFSCNSTKVARVDADTVVDLDGYWNDTDVRIVCESLIADCTSSPRIAKFEDQNGRPPIVILGKIKNESSERIDTTIVSNTMRRAILNSGVMDFVASKTERDALRDEKQDQADHASLESAKAIDNEEAADFMLAGSVKTNVQKEGNKAVRTYFVYVSLTNIETNKIIWEGENSEIKKLIKNQKVKL